MSAGDSNSDEAGEIDAMEPWNDAAWIIAAIRQSAEIRVDVEGGWIETIRVAPSTQTSGTTIGAWAERLMGSKLVLVFLVTQKGSFSVFLDGNIVYNK